MNLELLRRAKDYIEKLANGINPNTGESISNDSILNDIKIIRCLFYVKDILEENIKKCTENNKKTVKVPFNISREELNGYNLDKGSVSVSKIVKEINNLKNDEYMMKLKVTDLTKWLISIGLLEQTKRNDKNIKLPTKEGIKMGMYVENRYGTYGNYSIVLYKKEMQEFIINNFECLLDFIHNS